MKKVFKTFLIVLVVIAAISLLVSIGDFSSGGGGSYTPPEPDYVIDLNLDRHIF